MVITGDHDTGHADALIQIRRRAADRPGRASTGVAGSGPVLGSWRGETVTQAIAQSADIYAFLAENLDMQGPGRGRPRPKAW